MGCGSSKVQPEVSMKGYVSVVQSLVAFTKACSDDNKPRKHPEVRSGCWFRAALLLESTGRERTVRDGRHLVKSARYKDRFDSRVTARYDIKALVGRGSFSRVVRVEHRATRRPFAIKMMQVVAPEAREVCASELAVLQRVSHSNVIQMIEVFQFPQRVYMVLELATGGELLDRVISRGHFTERDATRALRMVLAGVGYLHSLGITHRDLKPDNLLYYHPGADSRLLITDFGLATFGGTTAGIGPGKKESDSAWPLRTTCGTIEYMAPEVLLRKPHSSSVDMWALGAIAYVVLSGSLPFEDDSRTRLCRSIVRGKYRFHGDNGLTMQPSACLGSDIWKAVLRFFSLQLLEEVRSAPYFFRQITKPWPSVSNLAKDFIQRLLFLDPATRLTADQATHHPWVATMAASSPMRNLHRSISQNLRQRTSRSSTQCPSRTRSSADCSSSVLNRLMSPALERHGRASGVSSAKNVA